MLATTLRRAAPFALLLAIVACDDDATSIDAGGPQRQYGAAVAVGNGRARTYVLLDASGTARRGGRGARGAPRRVEPPAGRVAGPHDTAEEATRERERLLAVVASASAAPPKAAVRALDDAELRDRYSLTERQVAVTRLVAGGARTPRSPSDSA